MCPPPLKILGAPLTTGTASQDFLNFFMKKLTNQNIPPLAK